MSKAVRLSDLELAVKTKRQNWVSKAGGLPPYVKRIQKHLEAKGFSESHAIATAINAVKKMKKTGDLNFPGRQKVNAKSRAEASGAVARWQRMKKSTKKNMSIEEEGLQLATANKAKGRSYGQGAKKLGRIHLVNVARLATPTPGAPPQQLPNLDSKVRSPKGGHIEHTKHGAVPSGGKPKRVEVWASSAVGKGPSDKTKVAVRRVREAMANANWNPNAKQKLSMGANTDAGVKMKRAMGYAGAAVPKAAGPTPRRASMGRDSWKGVGHAAPARVSLSLAEMELIRREQAVQHIDLAYNARQPRDKDGQWSRIAGKVRALLGGKSKANKKGSAVKPTAKKKTKDRENPRAGSLQDLVNQQNTKNGTADVARAVRKSTKKRKR